MVDLATDSPDGRPYTVREVTPPHHEPGSLPRWLQAEGVNTVIAGGLGGKALQMLEQQGMRVISGAPILPLTELLEQALNGSLPMGVTLCPQGEDHSCSNSTAISSGPSHLHP